VQQIRPMNQHIGDHIALWSSTQATVAGGIALVALIFVFVVVPAVWSRKPDRRAAAFVVLDLILRFFRR
jgi:hypothetical protein